MVNRETRQKMHLNNKMNKSNFQIIQSASKSKMRNPIVFPKNQIKSLFTFLLILIISLLLPKNETRKVSCDEFNSCKITYDSGKEYIPSAFGVNLNFIYDKNLKKDSDLYDSQLNSTIAESMIYNTKLDPKVEMLFGSQTYQCADGLDECPGMCCKMGICSDPSNVCLRQKANRNLIFIITGSLFGLLIFAYWIVFFYLGVKYNSTFSDGSNIKELDMIYRKPFKKVVENMDGPPDTEFNPNANYESFAKKKHEEGDLDDLNTLNKDIFDENDLDNNNDNNIIGVNSKNNAKAKNRKEANKIQGTESFIKMNKAKLFANTPIEDLHGNQFGNNINYESENEIIEEDHNTNVLGSTNFDNPAVFSYNRIDESKATRVFGVNVKLDRYNNPLLKSTASIRNNNNISATMQPFTSEIIKEENIYNKISNEEEDRYEKENFQKLNNQMPEEAGKIKPHNSNSYNKNSIQAKENKKNEKDLDNNNNSFNRVSLDGESLKDKYDIFSSQNSFPSKSVNSKRRLIKRVTKSINEYPIGSFVSSHLEDEKENYNRKSKIDDDKDLQGNRNKSNEEKKKTNNYHVESNLCKGIYLFILFVCL